MVKVKGLFLLSALTLATLSVLPSSAAAETGVFKDKILLGSTCVLSGPQAENGVSQLAGMRVFWAGVNEKGGVFGKNIEIKALDDAYDGKKSKVNAETLADETFILIGATGTGSAMAILPVLEAKKIPMVGALTGMVPRLRDGSSKLMFNVRASYADEADFIASMLKSFGQTSMMLLVEDGPFGKIGIDEFTKAAAKAGITIEKDGVFKAVKGTDAEIVAGIAKKGNSIPLVMVLAGSAPKLLKDMKAAGVKNQKYAVSPIGSLHETVGKDADGVMITQVVPPIGDLSIPIVREYREAVAKYDTKNKPSAAGLEGFLTAKITLAGLLAAGATPTRDGFAKAMEAMQSKDYGGQGVIYNAKLRNGSNFIDIVMVSNKKLIY